MTIHTDGKQQRSKFFGSCQIDDEERMGDARLRRPDSKGRPPARISVNATANSTEHSKLFYYPYGR
jgi:hypothetical protein